MNESDLSRRLTELSDALSTQSGKDARAKLYIERASVFYETGNNTNSVKDYLEALELAENVKDLVHIKSMISLLLLHTNEKERALWWAFAAIAEDCRNDEGHYLLGLNCRNSEFYSLAVESFRRALELAPNNRLTRLELGISLRDAFRLDEAVEALSEYVVDYPEDPRGLYELGWTYEIHIDIPDWKAKAAELFKKALNYTPPIELKQRIERKLASLNECDT